MTSHRGRYLLRAIAVGMTAMLAAGCGSGTGPRDVFTVMTGISQSGPIHVDEIENVGLPGLYNISGSPVRLRSVEFVGQPSAVHIRNVRAYNIKQEGYGDILSMEGDLPSECPGHFVPHPIGSFTVPPHKLAAYFVVIAFTISKPGVYHLNRVKIRYTSDGRDGWQYQNLNFTLTAGNPPLPGLRPLPKSAVCGKP